MSEANDRKHAAIRSAIAMCSAGARGDLLTVYEVWNTAGVEHRADLIAALAQVPGSVLQAIGKDPIKELEAMALQIAANEGTENE